MAKRDAQPDLSGAMRIESRERIYAIWQRAQAGEPLEGEEAHLARAMRDHPEWYDVWAHANEFRDEIISADGVNPFLHACMHSVIESQAAQDTPPEVRAILQNRSERHEAIHEIANVFTPFLWTCLHEQQPFDNDGYRRALAKLLPRRQRR